MNKRLRRSLYLAVAELRGRSSTRFAPHGVGVTIPKGIDDNIRYQLTRGRPYEAAESTFIRAALGDGMSVIELGGSLGVISALIRSVIGPQAKHLIVEANEALIPVCTANALQGAQEGATELVCAAIDYSGAKTVSFDFGSGAHVGMVSKAGSGGVQVPAIKLRDLVTQLAAPRFALVCDIEGMEAALFENERALLSQIDVIILELHPHAYPDGQETSQRLARWFEEAGLRCTGQSDDVVCYVRSG